MSLRLLLIGMILAAVGCGGGGNGDDDTTCEETGRYLELTTGASWTYRVTDTGGGGATTKTQTVGPMEDIGGNLAGTMAFRLTTVKGATGQGMVLSWQQDTGDGVIRLREQDMAGSTTSDEYYAPMRQRIDETPAHLVVGAAWDHNYTETVSTDGGAPVMTAKVEHWSVIADDEIVTVPAGEFCTIHIHRTSEVGGIDGSTKDYWFARGVGKVKEVAAGQIEELAAYTR
jgi:hypothetical protein